MSEWRTIGQAFHALLKRAREGGELAPAWADFARAAEATRGRPPMHLAILFDCIAELERGAGGRPLVILEHGCGAGLIAMYLLALGHRGVWGVDVGGDMTGQNRVLREVLGIHEARFSIYDGRRLSLGDGTADLVFSQQVLEHVTDDVIDAYYAEEARILRPGGLAYHQLPHRWGPYDSHSRTWFLHWFPRSVRMAGYRALKRNPDYLARIIHLRAPGAHFRRARAFIGPVRDLTVERLTRLPDMTSYEGSARLRRMIHAAVRAPVLGPLAGFALKRLAMLDTVAVRR